MPRGDRQSTRVTVKLGTIRGEDQLGQQGPAMAGVSTVEAWSQRRRRIEALQASRGVPSDPDTMQCRSPKHPDGVTAAHILPIVQRPGFDGVVLCFSPDLTAGDVSLSSMSRPSCTAILLHPCQSMAAQTSPVWRLVVCSSFARKRGGSE